MLNHQVKTIADMTKFDTKQPLPLLLVELESKSNNIDIQCETSIRHCLCRLSKNYGLAG